MKGFALVAALMAERGYGHVYESWPAARLDTALAWTF